MRKPFWKSSHNCWYYKDAAAKDQRLDPDEDTALDLWRELVQGKRRVGKDARVADLVLRFLDWSKVNQAESTYQFYRTYLESFRKAAGNLKVSALCPFHVTDWVTDQKWTNPNTIHGAMRAVQRAFNWSKKQGLINVQPLDGLEKPAPRPREVELSAEQFQTVLSSVKDPAFRDVLVILRETGARPQEVRTVDNRYFDRRTKCWLFPPSQSKGKRHPRVVLLNAKALEITKRYADKYKTGPIFRNGKGEPWSKTSLTQRCERLSEKTKIKIRPYSIRHHFVDEALVNDADPVALSVVLGHASPKMVTEVYQNVRKRTGHLEETLRRATGGSVDHRRSAKKKKPSKNGRRRSA